MKGNQPFFLKPSAHDYLWGGNRLNDDFSKGIDMSPLAETWECSTHPDGSSIVSTGEFAGEKLSDLIRKHPEFLGSHPEKKDSLPILIKLIDAKQDLSIQVHPDDEYAERYENGQLGKDEMWYVLDAEKGSHIVYGLHHDVEKDAFRKSILDGTADKYLQKIPVKKNDVFYVKAGTIHAIGKGVLVAEVQESSNLTYRLYDYDRKDRHGNKRPLHIDKALDVACLSAVDEPVQPMRLFRYKKGCAAELLCRCKYFQAERVILNTERIRDMVEVKADSLSFQVLLCLDGCGMMRFGGKDYPFFKGDCLFVPADSETIHIHGFAQFLKVRC